MSLLKGSLSFIEFDVAHGDTANFGFLEDQVKAFAFKDIDDTYDVNSAGWVSVFDMFDSQFFDAMILGDYLVASLRIDERKVPGAILKKFVAKAEAEYKRDHQVNKISKATKIGIKERVLIDLLKQTRPTPTVADFVWNLEKGRVTLFSTNKSVAEQFSELFTLTFGLTATPVTPTSRAIVTNPELKDKQEIGFEFLTWLFFKSSIGDEEVRTLSEEFLNVKYNGKTTFIDIKTDEVVACSGSSDMQEATKAILTGKQVSQASLCIGGLCISGEEHDFVLTLTSALEFKGVKLPKTAKTETDETREGFVLERVYLCSSLNNLVSELFLKFLYDRTSGIWPSIQVDIRNYFESIQ